jgi:hypothetical protein
MKPSLFISNFNFMNKPILIIALTLVLVLSANIWAYRGGASGKFISSIPSKLIDGYTDKMADPYDMWFLGNSTLDNGIIMDTVKRLTNSRILKTPMGSGTAYAMSLLAIKGIKTTKHLPKQIFLFVTKDDFNANGLRAETSKRYYQAMNGSVWKEDFLGTIPLYSYRLGIKNEIQKAIIGDLGKNKKTDKKKASLKSVKTVVIDDKEDSHLNNLGKNYTLNVAGLKELAAVCKAKGIKVSLIWPPVTLSVVHWQDNYFPKQNYESIIESIRKECVMNGISFMDFTTAVPSTTQYFRDEYHLNKTGARLFSAMLAPKLN